MSPVKTRDYSCLFLNQKTRLISHIFNNLEAKKINDDKGETTTIIQQRKSIILLYRVRSEKSAYRKNTQK